MSDKSNLSKIVKLLRESFSPTSTIKEADYLFTSNEIIYAITDLDNSISKEEFTAFCQIMVDVGFTYLPTVNNNELKFVWMLKTSSHSENQV